MPLEPEDQLYVLRRTEAMGELSGQTVAKLSASDGDLAFVRDTLLAYVTAGYELGMVAEELIDAFCVSTPNILETAGFSGAPSEEIMAVFDEIHAQVWRSRLRP